MVARLTALMTINAAMWDYRNTPGRAAIFLDTIEKSMVDSEVGMNSSADATLQTLLQCTLTAVLMAGPPVPTALLPLPR
jgi:hypothetical protein